MPCRLEQWYDVMVDGQSSEQLASSAASINLRSRHSLLVRLPLITMMCGLLKSIRQADQQSLAPSSASEGQSERSAELSQLRLTELAGCTYCPGKL